MSDSAATAEFVEPSPASVLPGIGDVEEHRMSASRMPAAESSGARLPFGKSSDAEFGYRRSAPAPMAEPFRRELLQQFEGTILETSKTAFTARMKDLTAATDEVISFDLDEIPEHDRSRVQKGVVFYWNMGWMHFHYGTRMSYSEFVFRDLPLLSKKGREVLTRGSSEFDELFEL